MLKHIELEPEVKEWLKNAFVPRLAIVGRIGELRLREDELLFAKGSETDTERDKRIALRREIMKERHRLEESLLE